MRKNAFLVDADGNVKHTVIKLRMLHDMIEAEYIGKQNISNKCFSTGCVSVSNNGDNRLFIVDSTWGSIQMTQLKEPSTYKEMDLVRKIVNEFNG